MRRLILTIGLPRSGKSTWATGTGYPVVSSDAIRYTLFNTLWNQQFEHRVLPFALDMVKALFNAGHNVVIFDSINWTPDSRAFWLPYCTNNWELEYKIFKPLVELCKRRAMATGKDYLIPVIDRLMTIDTGDLTNPLTSIQPTKDEIDFFPRSL